MVDHTLIKFFEVSSLTGAVVNGSSCQHKGWRRGRGENTNISKPTAYTPVVIAAWNAKCFVWHKILFIKKQIVFSGAKIMQ